MYSAKEFRENLAVISAIKDITTVYQEIASMRVKQLREGVEKTREFLDGTASVYNHAKASYVVALKRRAIRGKADLREAGFIKRNGKKILVFLSANEHLYGSLILDVWQRFILDLKKGGADAAVIGSIGRYFMRNEKLKVNASYFALNDDKPTQAEVKKIADYISKYEQVSVYYGQVISILNQLPTRRDIFGGATISGEIREAKSYLFEPSPAKILEFFETEIIAALFNQTIYEHQLARFAARMIAMDQATENANETLSRLNRDWRAAKRAIASRKQLGVFAGVSLWSDTLSTREEET